MLVYSASLRIETAHNIYIRMDLNVHNIISFCDEHERCMCVCWLVFTMFFPVDLKYERTHTQPQEIWNALGATAQVAGRRYGLHFLGI